MKTLLAFILIVTFCAASHAQSATGRKADPAIQARFRDSERSSANAVGRVIPKFSGVTLNDNAALFTHLQLRQRVTVMCFWYASCNCFRPAVLDTFSQVKDPRFQIVSFMPDSFMYSQFVQQNSVRGAHVLMDSRTAITELNLVGGYPVLMLVDGGGKVLKTSRVNIPEGFDGAAWRAAISEALMF